MLDQGIDLLHEDVCREWMFRPLPDETSLSVVVPIFNEKATIGEIIRRIRAVPIPKEIILVDDGSTDGTRDVLATFEGDDLRIVLHEKNRGKGAAVRTGFALATGDIVIIQDADLEYDPREYRRLIQPIVDGVADVVYGSRFLPIGPQRVLDFWHSAGNRALPLFSNMFTGLHLTDMETCYKVFRRDVVEAILPTLREERFGIDPELTAKISHRHYRVYEVGITYSARTYREGKKIGLPDACRTLWCILLYWWKDSKNPPPCLHPKHAADFPPLALAAAKEDRTPA